MHIEEKDCLELYYYLQYEQERGMQWMLYDDDKTGVTAGAVISFATQPEMAGFQKQYPAFAGDFKQAPIESVVDAMEEIVKQDDDLVPANIELKVTPNGAIVINQQKTSSMNNENVDFLHNQIKFAGFGEDLHKELVKQLKADAGGFTLQHAHTFGKDNVDSVLNFKKSKESDMYFFNSYDITVKREGKPDISNTFYINQGQSITMKEAYNLLNGRSVEKELLRNLTPGEKEQYKAEWKLPKEQRFLPENWEKAPHYMAWVKLDLDHRDKHGNFIQKHFHENFGFKLEDALAKLPLRNMNASEMADLQGSLQKGNLAQATFTVDGENKKFLLAVDPQFKAITVYNTDMTLAKKETFSQHTKKEEEGLQQPKEQINNKDLVQGPEAPWEEKKSAVKKGEEKDVTKADLLPKNKKDNGLLEKKEKQGEGKKMKVA